MDIKHYEIGGLTLSSSPSIPKTVGEDLCELYPKTKLEKQTEKILTTMAELKQAMLELKSKLKGLR